MCHIIACQVAAQEHHWFRACHVSKNFAKAGGGGVRVEGFCPYLLVSLFKRALVPSPFLSEASLVAIFNLEMFI